MILFIFIIFKMANGELGLLMELAAQHVEEEFNPGPGFATTHLRPMVGKNALEEQN